MSESRKLCFVVGPIGAEGTNERRHADLLMRLVIRPVMDQWPEFDIQRADQIAEPGMIDRQIITRLRDADLVIADLSTLNANAFYEIGIRHMVSKPIVHMQKKEESTPFDVSLFRAVKYSIDSVEGMDKAIEELKQQVAACLDSGHEVDNPVTRALGQINFDQKAMPEVQLIRAELDSLKAEVSQINARHQRTLNLLIRATAPANVAWGAGASPISNTSLSLATLGSHYPANNTPDDLNDR
jgi:hypothetical protein